MAEREGFEPSRGFTPCHVSSVVVSTVLTHLSVLFNCLSISEWFRPDLSLLATSPYYSIVQTSHPSCLFRFLLQRVFIIYHKRRKKQNGIKKELNELSSLLAVKPCLLSYRYGPDFGDTNVNIGSDEVLAVQHNRF